MAEDLEQLLAEGSELAVIGYHLQDSYMNIYSEARAELYGMLGLPHVVVDGSQSFDFSYAAILAAYDERININSHYSIAISAEREGLMVNASINVGQIGAPNPNTKVLHLVLTESHIPHTWYGGDEVNHAERLMIPDQFGRPIISEKGIKSIFDFEFEMDPTWLLQYCDLVAFVQDTITMEVVQAQTFSMESLVLFNDISLNSIKYPGSNYCLDYISPVVDIENYGVDTLYNCLMSYSLNGGEEYNYTWEGLLTTYSSEEITLPEISFTLGNSNTLQVNISMPNGLPDENPDNNSKNKNFNKSQVIPFQNLVLELKTDDFGSETSWVLLNSLGEEIYSGSNYENNTLYTINWELNSSDCFRFIIYDSAANGICCESGAGYYKIKNQSGLTYFVGGNFEAQETEMFEIDIATELEGNNITGALEVYPNPFNDEINIQSTLDISKVEVLNSMGKVIYSDTFINKNNRNINLSKESNGIYIIRFFQNAKWESLKILKH